MNALLRHSGALASAAVALPFGALALLAKPSWREGFCERLGALDAAGGEGGVWLHAASLGELRAAAALVPGLRERGVPLVVTTATTTARARIDATCGSVPRGLMPLDHPWCASRAVSRVRPRVLALVETELWPSWIAAAVRSGARVVVVSGRLSEASLRRQRRLRPLMAGTVARLAAVGARSDDDAARFASLGVPRERIRVTGDLKLEAACMAPPPPPPELVEAFEGERLCVAGSVHPGEVHALLDALDVVEAAGQALRLVLAPRHLPHLAEIEGAVEGRGRKVHRRAAFSPRAAPPHFGRRDVLLVDTHGELASLYALGCVAFVGGTLTRNGGHDLLEPLAAGAPVFFGPNTQNQTAARALLLESGVGRVAEDGITLGHAMLAELADSQRTGAALGRAKQALARHRGSTARTLELLSEQLRGGVSPGEQVRS